MLLYFALIIVFGFLSTVAVVLFVFGIIKKRKKLWTTGIVLFLIGVLGAFYSGYKYTSAAIDYVRSEQLQKDIRRGSELIGETLGSASSGVSEGLASTLNDEAISKLAQKSGIILGKSIKTIASGLDSTLGTKNVFLEKDLEAAGLRIGRAEESVDSGVNTMSVFIESANDYKGIIRITNYDQTGKTIDQSEKQIELKAGKGQVEKFPFRNASLGVTTYFIMSLVK